MNGAVTAKLGVGLSVGDVWAVSVAIGYPLNNPFGFFAIHRRIETVVTPTAEPSNWAVALLLKDPRVPIDEPLWQRRRRWTENRPHPVLVDQFDVLVQPPDVELAVLWLQDGPRELR